MSISRREFADLALRAAALPAASQFLGAWLGAAALQQPGSNAPPEPPFLRTYTPRFFDADDFSALEAFTDILIPADETPGARQAYCAHFIDFVLHSGTSEDAALQQRWRDALRALREAGFHAADGAGREALVRQMSLPEREPGATHPAFGAYRLIKRETVFAFYTSRAGLIEALDYRGNSFNAVFPACEHPEHRVV